MLWRSVYVPCTVQVKEDFAHLAAQQALSRFGYASLPLVEGPCSIHMFMN